MRHLFNKYNANKLWRLRFGISFALFLIIIILFFSFVVGLSRIDGSSMYPTLSDGQLVLYSRLDRQYERGDIVAVKTPGGERYVKRVAAVSGDTVDIADGKLYVNGKDSELPSYGITEKSEGIKYPLTLKEGQLFVIGDNRENSVDSRNFGPVSSSQIRGKILFS